MIEQIINPTVEDLATDVDDFYRFLKEEMFSNEIDGLSREYYYADHMKAILGVYTKLDEVTNLQCDYLEALKKCQNCQHKLKQDQLWKQKESSSFRGSNENFFEIQDLKAQLQDKNIVITHRDNSIHRRFWVLKAHDGKSQASQVYYVEGLNHNLFSIGQFCDADLEVAFRKSTCYVRDLKGNDLLTDSHGLDLYSITLQETTSLNQICLMDKATSSQA
ncbi:hypothetical protein Tco_0117943 [Tanacetum coccineum]